jgi:hypothetical protein
MHHDREFGGWLHRKIGSTQGLSILANRGCNIERYIGSDRCSPMRRRWRSASSA